MAPKRYVLIVDDDEDMRETLADVITESGFRVVKAASGASAIEEVTVQPFDFVLVDLTMPGLGGVEVIRKIKAIDPYVTAIAMTGLSEAEGPVSDVLGAGADAVLHKPFEMGSVLKMLEVGTGDDGGHPAIDLNEYEIQPTVVKLIPEEMARRHGVLPVEVNDGSLSLAMFDARSVEAIESVEAYTGLAVIALQSSLGDIQREIERLYGGSQGPKSDSAGAVGEADARRDRMASTRPVANITVVGLGDNGAVAQKVSLHESSGAGAPDPEAPPEAAGRREHLARPPMARVVALGEEQLLVEEELGLEEPGAEPDAATIVAEGPTDRQVVTEAGVPDRNGRPQATADSLLDLDGEDLASADIPGEVEIGEPGNEGSTDGPKEPREARVFDPLKEEAPEKGALSSVGGPAEPEDSSQVGSRAEEHPEPPGGDEATGVEYDVPAGPVKVFKLPTVEQVEARVPTPADETEGLSDEGTEMASQGEPVERARNVYEVRDDETGDLVDEPVAAALDGLLAHAVKDGASDIHIEPQRDSLRARYRINGVLHNVKSLPLSMHLPLVSRIKVLAGMSISERHHSQDGKVAVSVDGESLAYRVSTSNTAWGETVVLHGLSKAAPVEELRELGLEPETFKEYSDLLRSPCGMILTGGPVGSGRTTLLYASMHQCDHNERKVIAVEDPIEYRFDGITQMEVSHQKNMTMASLLTSSMRLDPDVVVVGDIRDRETAKASVQAALTGHLILASICAGDAVDAFFRLVDLGIEPFLITSALIGVVSQRLVRRVCSRCQVPRIVPDEEALAYEREMGAKRDSFPYGEGCEHCGHTGYKGRIGIYELLVVSEALRRLLLRGAGADEIRVQAVREGMVSLRRGGMLKVKEGVTTPHEVLRSVSALR